MNQNEFIEHYVATWLAAISAHGYEDRCSYDKHYTVDSIPVEDAYAEAEMAWEAVNRDAIETREAVRRRLADPS